MQAFVGRLRAIAITHEMLAGARWEGADLRAMAQRLVEPYSTPGGQSSVSIEGESLRLPASIAPSVCMILHELATNATKYGALSRPRGRVTLTWHREMRNDGPRRIPWLRIEWEERGGPPARKPQHAGFGTNFIEQTATYQLRGHATLDFKPAGLTCLLDVPLERPALRTPAVEPLHPADAEVVAAAVHGDGEHSPTAAIAASDTGNVAAVVDIGGRRVLIVEDDLLVAQSLASHVQSLGCEVIGPAATSEDACAIVKSRPVDAAILDINLSAGTSAPVARALAGRHTPFTFVTGYSNLKTLPDDLRGQRVLCKPVDKETLSRALRDMASM
jgi:two-component sensor histidine kinase